MRIYKNKAFSWYYYIFLRFSLLRPKKKNSMQIKEHGIRITVNLLPLKWKGRNIHKIYKRKNKEISNENSKNKQKKIW